jgi:hypothetical protein
VNQSTDLERRLWGSESTNQQDTVGRASFQMGGAFVARNPKGGSRPGSGCSCQVLPSVDLAGWRWLDAWRVRIWRRLRRTDTHTHRHTRVGMHASQQESRRDRGRRGGDAHPYPTGDTATNTSAPVLRLPVPLPASGTVAVSYSISITGAERSDMRVGKPHASGRLPRPLASQNLPAE